MEQRDLKIGLVAGLVLVIAVVVKLAIDPRLSPEARMMQLNNSAESGIISDSNEKSGSDFVARDLSLELQNTIHKTIVGQPEEAVIELNSAFVASGSSLTPPITSPDSRVIQQEGSLNAEIPVSSVVTQNTDSAKTSDDTKDNILVAQGPASVVPETFDYEKAEIIKTERFHFVLKNETLSDISRKYYGSAGQWKKIVTANPDVIKDPNKVKAGTKLIIP
jgi:LysM repeat protein